MKNAGIRPHIAPASRLETNIVTMSSQFGITSRSVIMQAAVARQPAIICPSPPMFQKRILNAGVTASETHRSMATFCSRTQMRLEVPKAPSIIAP